MDFRAKMVALLICAAVALTGCGKDRSLLSHEQVTDITNNDTAGLETLWSRGYVPIAITDYKKRQVLLLRVCGDAPTRTDCLAESRPSKKVPDVYLYLKSADNLTLAGGSYFLMYSASKKSHDENGLLCTPEPKDTKLSDMEIKAFDKLGSKTHDLEYHPTQDVMINDRGWVCDVVFGQTL